MLNFDFKTIAVVEFERFLMEMLTNLKQLLSTQKRILIDFYLFQYYQRRRRE